MYTNTHAHTHRHRHINRDQHKNHRYAHPYTCLRVHTLIHRPTHALTTHKHAHARFSLLMFCICSISFYFASGRQDLRKLTQIHAHHQSQIHILNNIQKKAQQLYSVHLCKTFSDLTENTLAAFFLYFFKRFSRGITSNSESKLNILNSLLLSPLSSFQTK